jgi:alpha-ketoglutarate-dependent 2,4-dichlorophenoxyacetate dioxygenase
MSLHLEPLHPVFAAEASGIDLTKPLRLRTLRAINAAMNEHGVLVWRGQPLTAQQQIDFATSFGPLDIGLQARSSSGRAARGRAPDRHLQRRRSRATCRRDSPRTCRTSQPALAQRQLVHEPRAAYSMLHCVIKPSWGGDTEFADLRHAYDTLDERTRARVEDLEAEHYALHTRLLLGDEAYTDAQKKEIAPAVWPLVDTHPGSGRKVLFVGVSRRQIVGWPTAEGRMFLLDAPGARHAARAGVQARVAGRRPR